MNYNKNREKSGITLIALVVTIIVLLILAGVSINMLTGQNGILNRAKEAKEKTELTQKEEEGTLIEYEKKINEFTDGKDVTLKNINTQNTNPTGAMPYGMTVIENDANKGIVISDQKNNEWVWVEVPKTEVFSGLTIDLSKGLTEENYEEIEKNMLEYASVYREGKKGQECEYKDEWYDGCGLSEKEYKIAYDAMLKNVYKYGGFWIGRYEAGIEGSVTDLTKARYTHTELGNKKAIIQKNAIAYNYIYCSEAEFLASNIMENDNYISSLMFGIQWDLVCKYLEMKTDLKEEDINVDSSKWGNYGDAKIENIKNGKYAILSNKTYKLDAWNNISMPITKDSSGDNKWMFLGSGISEYTNKMNIYDFAGNVWEWTLENSLKDETPSVSRGGYFYYNGSTGPASYRAANGTTGSDYHFSFRPTFYEK